VYQPGGQRHEGRGRLHRGRRIVFLQVADTELSIAIPTPAIWLTRGRQRARVITTGGDRSKRDASEERSWNGPDDVRTVAQLAI